jgi:hypothetical protein
MITSNIVQAAYRARNDDGSETSATWKAALNTSWSQDTGQIFRLRIAITDTAGGSINNTSHALQYRINGGAWVNVTTSTPVQFTTSANVADATPTTQQITGGTFSTDPSEVDSDGTITNAPSWAGSDSVEYEAVLLLDDAQFSGGETVEFQQVGLNGYTVVPSLSVVSAAQVVNASLSLVQSASIAHANLVTLNALLTLSKGTSLNLEGIGLGVIINAALSLNKGISLDATRLAELLAELDIDSINSINTSYVEVPTVYNVKFIRLKLQ